MKNPNDFPSIDRRAFIRLVALFGAGAALAACREAPNLPPASATPTTAALQTPAPAASATPTANLPTATKPPTATASPTTPSLTPAGPGRSQVALVSTTDRGEGVRRAVDLLGPLPISGQRVFIKPNFNSADPAPGSTHPEVLNALILKLQEMGAAHITLGDRSGMGDTRQVMQRLGVFDLASRLGVETLVLDELPAEGWTLFNLPGSHWAYGFPFARPCLESGAVVQACCLKTHRYGGHFTLSLKNSVGLVAKRIPGQDYNYMTELHNSPDQRLMIAEINLAYQPALVVLDGVEAFVSGGPDKGELVRPGVMLASADRVAIDAVGVAILRLYGTTPEVSRGPVFGQEQLARAAELGLGAASPNQIEILTADPESAAFAARLQDLLAAN